MRGIPVQRFPEPAVHQVGNPTELLVAVDRQVRPLGQELPNKAIGVLVGASLSRAVRNTEIHRNPCICAELLVMANLFAPVIGQRHLHGPCAGAAPSSCKVYA